MGLTGFVLKDLAAIAGPVGYTLKGVAKQVERGRVPTKQIRRARIAQGQRELRALPEDERRRLIDESMHGWDIIFALWQVVKEGKDANEDRPQGASDKAEEVEANRTLWDRLALGKSRRDKKSLGAAFESVEVAEEALAAVRRGESLESAVAPLHKDDKQEAASAATRGRKSEDSTRRRVSGDRRRSREMGRDQDDLLGKGKKAAKVTEAIEEEEGTGESGGQHTDKLAVAFPPAAPPTIDEDGKDGKDKGQKSVETSSPPGLGSSSRFAAVTPSADMKE